MGLRGFKGRDPEEARRLGNPGHRTKAELGETDEKKSKKESDKPVDKTGSITPPNWLIPEALDEWNAIAPALIRMGSLQFTDRSLFAKYCQCVGYGTRYDIKIAKMKNPWKKVSNGSQVVPEMKYSREYWAEAARLAPLFGITHRARTAMNLKLPPPIDPEQEAERARKNAVLTRT